MAYGILAHTVGKLPLQQLIQKLAQFDLDFTQLALSKAISDIDTGLGKLSPGLANHVAEQFARQGIRIGVLGCYINPIHPDPEQRRHEINRFKEHLRFARDFGTSIVATETGDLTTYLAHDAERHRQIGWSVLKATIEELAEEAEKWGAYVGLEPVCVHTLCSSELMTQLLEEVPSSHIGVVFDPCNLLDQENYASREVVVANAFQLFGDRILLAHLRDVTYRDHGRIPSTKLGTGTFNIADFLIKLGQYKPFVDISIEGIEEDDISDSIHYVKELTLTNRSLYQTKVPRGK